MAVTTPEEFFDILQKSKLLTPSQLAQARELAREDDESKALAKRLARKDIITRWQAGQLLAGRSSFYLGKYRLIELLGSGGMGNVFLGRHVTMNRLVALKIISRRVGKDPASLDRFLAEARAVAALDHPNIVQAYSVDTEGDRYYMVMEYVEGLDLQQMVEEDGPLDCRLAVDYIRQVAEGLEHAHQRNMIHCDVKPSNLLVNLQGVVKILDLGLARLTHGDPADVSDSQENVLGSVDYLAPEQAIESAELDYRADIYSLGCTLYFLLSGRPPFAKGTLHERILKHQTQPPPRLPSDVPSDLAAICMKMMEKSPDDRFPSAAEVYRVLGEWRPARAAARRAVPLRRAKPLEYDDEFSEQGLSHRTGEGISDRLVKKSRLGRLLASLFATPLRSTIVVAMLSLALLGPAFLAYFYSQNTAKDKHEPSGQEIASSPNGPAEEPLEQSTKTENSEPPESPPIAHETSPEPPSVDQPPEPPETPASPVPEPPVVPAEKPVEPAAPQQPPPQAEPEPEPAAEPPKAEPPPSIETSLEFAGAADLPPLADENDVDILSVTLGKVQLAPDDVLSLELVGGTEVFRAGKRFVIDRDFGLDADAWLIAWESDARGPAAAERREIARIALQNGELRFRWLKDVVETPAGYLRNCGLIVSAGDSSCFIQLCKPTAADPVAFDFARRSNKPVYHRDDMPEAGVLRLQILGFSPEFPAAKMEPGDTVGARKEIGVNFEGPNLPPLRFQIEFNPRPKAVQLEIAATCIMPGKQQHRPLRIKEVETMAAQVSAVRKQLESVANNMRSKDRMNARKQLTQSAPLAAQLAALSKFCREVGAGGKIYFRVYAEFGDRRINLLMAPPLASTHGESVPR